jgi:DNA-directed RNA polymerase subunit M/transcription elongation factor TFIIS
MTITLMVSSRVGRVVDESLFMETTSACQICGGTMKADDHTKPLMRCDKCGHQETGSGSQEIGSKKIISKRPKKSLSVQHHTNTDLG